MTPRKAATTETVTVTDYFGDRVIERGDPESYRGDPDLAVAYFVHATKAIEDLNQKRATHTSTRRATVLALQAEGWSIQRIATATGLSKAAIGQVAKSAQ
jgi:DNA-directed RNA polymerase specialized sigma24 family protein